MDQVTGRAFGGEAMVETDATTFTDCSFDHVQLVYRGGEHPLFDSCRFGPGVRWSFLGPALKTIQLLQRIRNAEGGEIFISDIFQEGKFFADEGPSAA
ncbi:MAG TPA: hypothetical protein VE820_09775 [Sphingomicrobium sp.]|jgi:hypothetical protein|nr:hypothetical protein [Sphingomicrobium sp.]